MTPRAVVSSVDEPPGRSDLGGRRTPQLQVRTTAVPAEAGRGRRSESPQLKPTILTLPRPWGSRSSWFTRSCSWQGLIAGGEERVQVERPQPRSGEDERPGGGRNRRQGGRT